MKITTSKTESASTINFNNWQEKKNKLQAQFPHLTDPDLELEEGKVEELIDKIHSKIGKTIGKTKAGLHKFIESL